MQIERLTINVPKHLKDKLDALKAQGYTASGYIRALLERELGPSTNTQSGRTEQKGR